MITPVRTRFSADFNRTAQIGRDIDRLSTQLATQKSLQAASDDPQAAMRVSQLRREQGNGAAYAANADTAATLATRTDNALEGVTTALERARELTVMAASDSYTAEQRGGFATELRGIASDIANASGQGDGRGGDLFPTGTIAAFPIGDGITASGTVSRAAAFDGVATASGSRSIADILEAAAVAAESGTGADRTAALGTVAAASDHVIAVHAAQGLDAARIDGARETLAAGKIDLEEERAGFEGVDTAQLITLIKSKMTTMDAANTVFGQIHQKSLFDILG